jgi:hypothetical protein
MYSTPSATTFRYDDTMTPDSWYFNGTVGTYHDCIFIVEDTRLTPEKLDLINFRIHYESVGRSRALAKAALPQQVLCTQVHHRPVPELFFRLRCQRLRPPQRWCIGK